ncbi:MAG: HNH endonuclease [Granulosicoccaceae bacterium]
MDHLSRLRILRLNIAGTPLEWLNWQEAICLYSREMIAWTYGPPVAEVYGGTNRQSGHQSSAILHGVVASHGPVNRYNDCTPNLNNRALFSRDHYHCLYCGQRSSAEHLTRDHVIPVSKGGKDSWTNLVTACRRCNQKKGDRTPEACDMPLLAVPYRPNRAEYLALVNSLRIRGDQMRFLSSHFSRNWRQSPSLH